MFVSEKKKEEKKKKKVLSFLQIVTWFTGHFTDYWLWNIHKWGKGLLVCFPEALSENTMVITADSM